MTLHGKTAIVTGGARGIGKAIVRRFLSDGAAVVIADHDEVAGEAAFEEFKALGKVSFVATDVSESLDVHNLIAETLDGGDAIDIVVNNAAISHAAPFLELAEEDFDRVLRVNLKGAFLCSQAAARAMVRRVEDGGPAGTIINISSIDARLVLPEQVPYCVSRAGMTQLTAVLAVALAPHGIRVNAIGPGSIGTDMPDPPGTIGQTRQPVLSRTPRGRVGHSEEIAGIAAFLASDEAGHVTGQTIHGSGGSLPLNGIPPVAG